MTNWIIFVVGAWMMGTANAADKPAWDKMLLDYTNKMKSQEVSPLSVVDSAYLKKDEVDFFEFTGSKPIHAHTWVNQKPASGHWLSATYDGKRVLIQDQSGKTLIEDLILIKKQKLQQGLWITGQVISPTEARIKIHDPHHPLLKSFKKLDFYPYAPEWAVEARLELQKPYRKFTFTTVRDRTQEFWAVGNLIFTVHGTEFQVPAYVGDDDLKAVKELFIPFKDQSNGRDTYGGGRYVDATFSQPQNLESAPGQMKLTVDFNHAYQPFCAFSKFYNCVRVPGKPLNTVVHAGEKIGKHNLAH